MKERATVPLVAGIVWVLLPGPAKLKDSFICRRPGGHRGLVTVDPIDHVEFRLISHQVDLIKNRVDVV